MILLTGVSSGLVLLSGLVLGVIFLVGELEAQAGESMRAAAAATPTRTPTLTPTPTPTQIAERELRVPESDYRKLWVQLGTFSVLGDNPEEGAKELHAVYMERTNVEQYLKTGRFPDGAVLVKDVFSARMEELTTGTASYAGKLKGRFVMMKDDKRRYFGTSTRFGDGWGWAFFEGDARTRPVTRDYKADCLGCHEPVRNQDLVFTQGYPVLKH